MKTGLQAFRMATGGIIVGYNYLFSQALLLEDGWLAAASHFALNIVGLTLIAGAMSGHFKTSATTPIRALALATGIGVTSAEHTSEFQSLMRISFAVFCLNKKHDIL